MDSNTINYNEEVLKGGLIIAGVSILFTMVPADENPHSLGSQSLTHRFSQLAASLLAL